MSAGYLLDTSILVFLLRRRHPVIVERMERSDGALHVSTISVAELTYGASRSSDPLRNRVAVEEMLSRLSVLDFGALAASRSGTVRADLAARGTPIGGYDLLLACQALASDLTMVTNNVNEFERVRGLRVEDWSQQA